MTLRVIFNSQLLLATAISVPICRFQYFCAVSQTVS